MKWIASNCYYAEHITTPYGALRFVERDGKHVLQMYTQRADAEPDWVDIPLVEEDLLG